MKKLILILLCSFLLSGNTFGQQQFAQGRIDWDFPECKATYRVEEYGDVAGIYVWVYAEGCRCMVEHFVSGNSIKMLKSNWDIEK